LRERFCHCGLCQSCRRRCGFLRVHRFQSQLAAKDLVAVDHCRYGFGFNPQVRQVNDGVGIQVERGFDALDIGEDNFLADLCASELDDFFR
jgi:hypothetical protein